MFVRALRWGLTALSFSGGFAVFAAPVFAGGHVTNGGRGVVCADSVGKISRIQLYDFQYGDVFRPDLVRDLGPATLKWPDKVEIALKRWDRLEPDRASRYRAWASQFMADANFLTNTTLPLIPDAQEPAEPPPGCIFAQLANQKDPEFPGDRRYVIDADLFNNPVMSEDDRAGLVLHELVYREAIGFGVTTSDGVRYLVELASSPVMDTVTRAAYVNDLRVVGFGTAVVQGATLDLTARAPSFYDNDRLNDAEAVNGSPLKTPWRDIHVVCRITFDQDGNLIGLSLAPNEWLVITYQGRKLSVAPQRSATDPCADDPQNPHIGYDLYIGPRSIIAHISGGDATPLKGPNFDLNLAGYSQFLEGAVLFSKTMYGTVKVGEVQCPVASDLVGFYQLSDGVQGPLQYVSVLKCAIQIGQNHIIADGEIGFDEVGRVDSTEVEVGLHTLLVGGRQVTFRSVEGSNPQHRQIMYFPNGTVRAGTLGADQTLPAAGGQDQAFLDDSWTVFDQEGNVISSRPWP